MQDYTLEWVSLYLKYNDIDRYPEEWFFKEGTEEKIFEVRDFVFQQLPEEIQTKATNRYLLRILAGDPRWNEIK